MKVEISSRWSKAHLLVGGDPFGQSLGRSGKSDGSSNCLFAASGLSRKALKGSLIFSISQLSCLALASMARDVPANAARIPDDVDFSHAARRPCPDSLECPRWTGPAEPI
jgi:hypothetical protein